MKSRDDVIAQLADEIVSGVHRTPLADALDAILVRPLISNEDAAMLLFSDEDTKLAVRDRMEKAALDVTVSWLRHSPRGTALVAERMERDAEEREEEQRSAA